MWCDVFEITVFGVRLFLVYSSPNIELLTRGVNLPSNHGNNLLYITHNRATMDILSWHVYKGTIIIKMTHNQVSIGLLYSTFPLYNCYYYIPRIRAHSIPHRPT